MLPGRRPVGFDPETGALVVLREVRLGRRRFVPHAVGGNAPARVHADPAPGGARPPLASAEAPVLPQWAYTAAGFGEDGPVAWALHTDRREPLERREPLDPRPRRSG